MSEREAIVAEALAWEGTPYHSHGRIKGIGADCAQLPIAVYSATGHIPDLHPDYAREWMTHHDEELYLAHVFEWAREIEEADAGAGDLIVFKFGRVFSHSAIIIEPGVCLHAYVKARAVVRSDYVREVELAERKRRFFSVFGREGGGELGHDAAVAGDAVAGEAREDVADLDCAMSRDSDGGDGTVPLANLKSPGGERGPRSAAAE